MNKLHIECDPKTARLRARQVLKNGTLSRRGVDVTDSALPSVAEHLLRTRQSIVYERQTQQGGVTRYRLNVKIESTPPPSPARILIDFIKRTFSLK